MFKPKLSINMFAYFQDDYKIFLDILNKIKLKKKDKIVKIYFLCVVGFSTAKGELVRSIMFPKPVDFKFSQDAFKFICVLALISSIGMVYTMVIMVSVDTAFYGLLYHVDY